MTLSVLDRWATFHSVGIKANAKTSLREGIIGPSTSMSGALALAEQIRTTVLEGRLRRIDRQQDIEDVTLSVGVAHGGGGDGLEDLVHRADAELYAAKRSGRNRVSPGAAPEPDARDDDSTN